MLFIRKTFIAQVFFSKCKKNLVVYFQCCIECVCVALDNRESKSEFNLDWEHFIQLYTTVCYTILHHFVFSGSEN